MDYWRDPDFGYAPARTMDSVLQRYPFHADWHMGTHVRAFGQFSDLIAGAFVRDIGRRSTVFLTNFATYKF